MEKITDSKKAAQDALDSAYRTPNHGAAIAAAIVWTGFAISEEIAKLREALDTKPLA